MVCVMPDRCNRETVGQRVPNMHSFQGAFEKAGIVDVALGLCATEEEFIANILRAFVFLNRHGPAFQHIRGRVRPEHFTIDLEDKIAYNPEDGSAPPPKRKKKSAMPEDLLEDR